MADVTVAPATLDDVRAVLRRRNSDDATLSIALELADRGGAWTARDQSEPIGLAIAADTPEERYLGEWYVEPSFRGQGIGARLLDAAFEDAGDRARAVALDPTDDAGLALVVRRGLSPRELLLRVAGAIPREERLAALAAGDYRFEVGTIDPQRHAFALDALDRETRGTTRASEHRRFAAAATGSAFFYHGDFVAYAYCWPDGRIGPVASSSPAYLTQIFAFALLTLQRAYGASWCSALIPGSNLRIARAALRSGLRILTRTVLASDTAGAELARYLAYDVVFA